MCLSGNNKSRSKNDLYTWGFLQKDYHCGVRVNINSMWYRIFIFLSFNPLLPLRQSYANKSGKSWVYMNPKSGLEIWLKESRFRFETHSKFM